MGPESSPRSFRTRSEGGGGVAQTAFGQGEEGSAAAPNEYELGRSRYPPVRRRQEAPPRADPMEGSVHRPYVQQPPPVGKSQAPRGDAGVGPVVTFDDQPPWRRRRWARPSAALANSSRNWPIKASPPRWKGGEPSSARRGVFRN